MTDKKSAAARKKAAKEVAGTVAGEIDQYLGRKAPKDPYAKVKGIEVDKLVTERVRQNPSYKIVNKGVRWSAFALTLIALGGQGTVSAVVAAATTSATVGSFYSFGQAFFLTFALSASTTLFSYMTLKGHMKSYGALSVWLIATLIIVNVAESAGFRGPSAGDIYGSMGGGSNPIAKAFAVMGVFLNAHNLLPFLSGVVVGAGSGWMISELEAQRVA